MALASLAFVACNKENISPKSESETQILAFKDAEEYQNTLSLVSKMSDDEFTQWEKSRNFISFESRSKAVYQEANPEKFSTQAEVIEFVSQNDQYLQLIKEDNGDFTLETKLQKSASIKRILNEDCMVQIGDIAVKFFASGVASAPSAFKQQLKDLSEKGFLAENTDISQETPIAKSKKNPNRKDIFGKDYSNRIDEGSNRLYLGVECSDIVIPHLPFFNDYHIEYTIRPYHKTLGIWYFCSRTIEGSIKLGVEILWPNNAIQQILYPEIIPPANRSVAKYSWDEPADIPGYSVLGFYGIDCWAKSASIPGRQCQIKIGAAL